MSGNMVKPKAGLQLRKIGSQYMIVKADEQNVNMSNVYTLNHTAARLWQQIEQGNATCQTLAHDLCNLYEVDEATALSDVRKQLDEWKAYGLLLP